jgi:hypothetical protein
MAIDSDWALQELSRFLEITKTTRRQSQWSSGDFFVRVSGDEAILDAAVVVEQILARVLPNWRTEITRPHDVDRWDTHVEAARRAKVALERQAELREKLGDGAPQLDAARLHPWVWEGARSLWQSGHFREAVRAAAVKVNAETQNKVRRRNLSEADLFKQAFSSNEPKLGEPRLRIIPNDGSRDFENVHRGARDFASGLYTAIRNPISHSEGELPEHEALEQLAAFSVLARWVDTAQLDEATT